MLLFFHFHKPLALSMPVIWTALAIQYKKNSPKSTSPKPHYYLSICFFVRERGRSHFCAFSGHIRVRWRRIHMVSGVKRAPPLCHTRFRGVAGSSGTQPITSHLADQVSFACLWSFDLLMTVHVSFSCLSWSRFSTDEGQCWHVYNFTDDPIYFTGLASEPGARSMNISLWGYRETVLNQYWISITIDFRQLLSRDCEWTFITILLLYHILYYNICIRDAPIPVSVCTSIPSQYQTHVLVLVKLHRYQRTILYVT